MNGVVASPAKQLSPYRVRRMMLGALKDSQAIEHAFFAQCREAVRHASTRLAEHFSNVIQLQMPGWAEQQCREFAQHSGVSIEAISLWKGSLAALLDAKSAASKAEYELKQAEAQKSDSGGWLFGPKKGREDEYRAASARQVAAENERNACRERVRLCKKSATEVAEALLKSCIARAGALAEASEYVGSDLPRQIMVDAASRAQELTAKHELEQAKINANLFKAIRFLGDRYGVARE